MIAVVEGDFVKKGYIDAMCKRLRLELDCKSPYVPIYLCAFHTLNYSDLFAKNRGNLARYDNSLMLHAAFKHHPSAVAASLPDTKK
jgi:hypothetical protein